MDASTLVRTACRGHDKTQRLMQALSTEKAETRTEEAKDEKAICKTCAGPRRTTFELKTGSDPIAELFSGPEVRTQIEEVCTPIEVCTQLRKLRCLEEVHTQIEEVRTQIEVHMQLRRMRVHIQLAEDAIQTGT